MADMYLILVWCDVEPSVHGPYKDDAHRLKAARKKRAERGDLDGIFGLDIVRGKPDVFAFSAGALEGE
jgi:hypothetical protein